MLVQDILVCPIHNEKLVPFISSQTNIGKIKKGGLFCNSCNKYVADIRNGKPDFVRVLSNYSNECVICEDFIYERWPWNHPCITSLNLFKSDFGVMTERAINGCLLSSNQEINWELLIHTDVTDLALRFLTHCEGGKINVEIVNYSSQVFDLFSTEDSCVVQIPVFDNLSGSKTIRVTGVEKNILSKGNKIYFFGLDICHPRDPMYSDILLQNIRGNHFPATYTWCLDKASPSSLLLDCSSGDRRIGDQRVIAFEYLPFELPDIYGDGHSLPFANDTFDVVFSQAVMEHLRDPYLAAAEIVRITKPGGLIYVESAFIQPLHGVPYHFFNTTTLGIEAIFTKAGVFSCISEWFGHLSFSIPWFLSSCGGGGLSSEDNLALTSLLKKIEINTTYENLEPVASAVAYWGVKEGGSDFWRNAINDANRPTYRY